jgi:hypothetical protein
VKTCGVSAVFSCGSSDADGDGSAVAMVCALSGVMARGCSATIACGLVANSALATSDGAKLLTTGVARPLWNPAVPNAAIHTTTQAGRATSRQSAAIAAKRAGFVIPALRLPPSRIG